MTCVWISHDFPVVITLMANALSWFSSLRPTWTWLFVVYVGGVIHHNVWIAKKYRKNEEVWLGSLAILKGNSVIFYLCRTWKELVSLVCMLCWSFIQVVMFNKELVASKGLVNLILGPRLTSYCCRFQGKINREHMIYGRVMEFIELHTHCNVLVCWTRVTAEVI